MDSIDARELILCEGEHTRLATVHVTQLYFPGLLQNRLSIRTETTALLVSCLFRSHFEVIKCVGPSIQRRGLRGKSSNIDICFPKEMTVILI